jgi:carboxyl-terminal processing protease
MQEPRTIARRSTRQARRAVAGVSLFAAGVLTGAALTASAKEVPYDLLHVFSTALQRIEASYVTERPPEALIYDAIGGLTQGLDDHSVFLSPDEYKDLLEQTRGEYYGVGISVESREERVFILTPVEGSPADQAGLMAGDEILAVDGMRVTEAGDDAVLAQIRGKRGTAVLITVLRDGVEQALDIRVLRDRVRTRSVEHKLLPDGTAWIKIKRFQSHTADEVKRSLAELKEERGDSLDGFVVDLRNNPGGYLSQAVAVADLWVAGGAIVSTVGRRTTEGEEVARSRGTDKKTPITVLVNSDSASAAEILAGALQDHGRAQLVGYTTYGKGSVQQFFDLPDGSALKLTTAHYLTPSGSFIHGSGIRPDVVLGDQMQWKPWKDPGALLETAPSVPEWVMNDTDLHVAFAALADPTAAAEYFRKESAPSPTLPDAQTAGAEVEVVAPPEADPAPSAD